MSLLAWKPPPELAEKALGPEKGGGRPSVTGIMRQDEHGTVCGRPVRVLEPPLDDANQIVPCVCGRTWHYMGGSSGWCHINTPVEQALVLAIDGESCRLSISRAADLHGANCCDNDAMSPREHAERLVERLGGEIVEVP